MSIDLAHAQDGLRHILNQWDPIGVADLVDDEYDCLIAPLLSKLMAGDETASIRGFLRHEVEEHFGLDPQNLDIDGTADRLVAWWAGYAAQAFRR